MPRKPRSPSTSTVTDVARNFADYLNRVAFRRERFTLTRGGQPVAELVPVPQGRRMRELPALLAGLPRLDEDEAERWASDLKEARQSLAEAEPRDPWDF